MLQVNTMTFSPNAYLHRRTLTILMLLLCGWILCREVLAESVKRTTIVIFADHRMPDEEWTDLSAALRKAQAAISSATPAVSGDVEIVRGDQMKPGLRVTTLITVFLRGNCTLMQRRSVYVQGALGWVPRSKTFIEPFVTVDCSRIADMLGPLALGMDPSRRDVVMAEAMARVILHEWVHIATQSAHHTSHGILQSEFSVWDLLADDSGARHRRNHGSM